MELRQLNTFMVVAEVCGFTRAAEILGYAQSSVTAQIQALEEELGTPLFDRLGKKIVMTEAGQRLLPYAREMMKLHQTAIEEVHAYTHPTGVLTIGAPESLAAYRLPQVIREYRKLFPQVKIVLKPGLCWELPNQIRNGQIDVAFLLEPESPSPDLHKETLVIENMTLIGPPDHPLTRRARVEPNDLKEETILHTEQGCSYRDLFEQHLKQNGVHPVTSLEFWNIEAIKNCVMCGLGISFLPLITVADELRDGKIAALAWDDSTYEIATQMIYHKGKWMSPALREFIALVRRHAETWRQAKS
jgi:DNA-binding transcriptional LysR family regulator